MEKVLSELRDKSRSVTYHRMWTHRKQRGQRGKVDKSGLITASYNASEKQLSCILHLRCGAQTFPLFDSNISRHESPKWVAK